MKHQRGGTFLGLIFGLVVGLGIALGVAVYVTKVPVPFINKGQSRSSDQDAAEARKNKDWDPNALIQGKNPVHSSSGAVTPSPEAAPTDKPASSTTTRAETKPEGKAETKSDAKSDAKPDNKPDAKPDRKPDAKSDAKDDGKADARSDTKPAEIKKPPIAADPLGDLARAKSSSVQLDPFTYQVQTGAFRVPDDAEAQRAKLSLMGIEVKVTEREQAGRTVYRVRAGPFERKEDAERAKEKLESAGVETVLVRVQR